MAVDVIVKHLGFSRNYFSAVENERSLLADDKLSALIELLEFDEAEGCELIQLSAMARKQSLWARYTDILGEDTVRFLSLEDGAQSIKIFESLLIPGLLQVPEYTRAVVAFDPSFGQVHVDQLTAIRQERQKKIQEEGVEFIALLSEAALRQQWGGSDIQVQQLEHLLDLGRDGSPIEIRVLPFDRPPGSIASSSTMVLLGFASPHLPTLVYQEAVRSLEVVDEDDDQFLRLKLAWDEGLSRALDARDSREFIRRVAESIQSDS